MTTATTIKKHEEQYALISLQMKEEIIVWNKCRGDLDDCEISLEVGEYTLADILEKGWDVCEDACYDRLYGWEGWYVLNCPHPEHQDGGSIRGYTAGDKKIRVIGEEYNYV